MIRVKQFAMLIALPDTGTAAKLHWREVTRPDGYNPNDETSAEGGVVVNREEGFRCFFHQIDARLSGYQRFAEIQTGDVMLDYLADLALTGKVDMRVEVGGKFYVQKTASKDLLEYWDTQSSAGGLGKTLLLSPAA
jgi:hypothetical protein